MNNTSKARGAVYFLGVIGSGLALWWADLWQKISDFVGSFSPF